MKPSIIVTLDGVCIDLARVKALKVKMQPTQEARTMLIVELDARYEYIFNPNKNQYEKVRVEDHVELEYYDHELALDHEQAWLTEWQDYCRDPRFSNL